MAVFVVFVAGAVGADAVALWVDVDVVGVVGFSACEWSASAWAAASAASSWVM